MSSEAATVDQRAAELRELLDRRARTRAVVLVDDAVVRRLDPDDLPVEEAAVARLDREVLRALGVLVHLLACHAVAVGHVLGRLAHRDVRVV